MQIFLSYFYAVRFFRPYMIPFSTAMWDPKWYHEGQNQNHIFIDKNGVINGLRADPLVPDKHCDGLCRGPERCEFKELLFYLGLDNLPQSLNDTLHKAQDLGLVHLDPQGFEVSPRGHELLSDLMILFLPS